MGAVDWGTGVVVAMSRRSPQKGVPPASQSAAAAYIVDVLLECEPGLAPGGRAWILGVVLQTGGFCASHS